MNDAYRFTLQGHKLKSWYITMDGVLLCRQEKVLSNTKKG